MSFGGGQRDAPVTLAIVREAEQRGIPIEIVPRGRLDQISHGAVHQGCVAMVAEREYVSTDDILAYAESRQEAPFLLMLDAIQDVNNLGSLLRTAEAAG